MRNGSAMKYNIILVVNSYIFGNYGTAQLMRLGEDKL